MKRLLCILLAFCLLLPFAACSTEDFEEETTPSVGQTDMQGDGSWVIYWYLCGSDLESGGGFATTDLFELMEVQLPENVKVVIQTGGSSV